jgi:DNA-damage-inducible protein J
MAQTTVNFRIDKDLKESMERACREMGLSMAAAFIIFAAKVSKEGKIPFEVEADPFYSEANMERLRKAIADVKAGKLTAHELIEADDE